MDQERSDAAVTDLEKELAEVLGPTLDRMAQQSHRISRSKGWWETPDPFDRKCMLMVTELAEAVEEQRDNHPLDEIYYADGKPEGVPIELADLLIRLLDACAYFKIPLAKAYAIKTAFNTTRPQKHGGKAF